VISGLTNENARSASECGGLSHRLLSSLTPRRWSYSKAAASRRTPQVANATGAVARLTKHIVRSSLLVLAVVVAWTAWPQRALSAQADDVLLRAMQAELDRNKAQLKMEGAPAPYYLEYRVAEVNEYEAHAGFGSVTMETRTDMRFLRAVVRIGDYKDDSYFGAGQGAAEFIGLDDDMLELRHQLWLITDRAYKEAVEALAAKRATLKKFQIEQPVDDFARAPAVQLVGPVVKLDADPQPWRKAVVDATALYRKYPDIQGLEAFVALSALNEYFVNSEGTVTRQGKNFYRLGLSAYTQAPDGLYLYRSPSFAASRLEELPAPQRFVALADGVLEGLVKMRDAPVVEEEYRGPVMFVPDAANDVVTALVGKNVLGHRPRPGANARTTGEYASSFKSRVLPEFVSVTDDPTLAEFKGQTLIGHYEIDAEGVKAQPVKVIENGILINYLLGRQPIRDFPSSNGHGRAAVSGPPSPGLGNLILTSSHPVSRDDLKKRMLEICHEQGKPYGYLVRTVASNNLYPLVIYRVWEKDGHEELVRGAVFKELDTRALRNNLIALGDDAEPSNTIPGVASSVISPSLLFDELEVKRTETGKEKLPEYPPPPLIAASK